MPSWKEQALETLARLGSSPATSFSEDGVAAGIKAVLGEMGVRFEEDAFGNILAILPSQSGPSQSGKSPSESTPNPPIAFVAHMDHPGFEIVASDATFEGDFLVGKALGGVPPGGFAPGLSLQVILPEGRRLAATIVERLEDKLGDREDRRIRVQLAEPQSVPIPCPAVFDLVDYQLDGDFIRMRALDDLAGCGSILTALSILSQEEPPVDVFGVFTRAEEVGLVGARLLAEANTLPKDTLVVSLESSRSLPGAEIGGGPVIRVGDAAFTFSAEAETVLTKAREILQDRPEPIKIQRQLMSGGTCEASAFAMQGYRATGIAFPLGNYHNGAPEERIEAEFIDLGDFLGGVELIAEAVRQVPHREDTAFRRRIGVVSEDFRRRLSR
ncbi:MAG: M28 family peptidase [Stenotrophomonas maltophilia]